MKAEHAEEYTQALGQIVAGGWRQIALGERLGIPKALGLTTQEWVEQRLGGYVRLSVEERHGAVKELTDEGLSTRKIAAVTGVSHETVAKDVRKLTEPVDTFAALAVAEEEDKQAKARAKREEKEAEREAKREENRELVKQGSTRPLAPEERFSTVVLDPPWDWSDEGDVDQFGRATPTYATLTFDEIAAWPVPDHAAADSHLYLWITNRSLPKGFALLDRWGFRYVTALTWVKPSIGMGNYYRGSTEHVLFGVSGSLPLLRNDAGTHFVAPRSREHSAKPDRFYELVEACSPGPWLEWFARRERPGWVTVGAEIAA